MRSCSFSPSAAACASILPTSPVSFHRICIRVPLDTLPTGDLCKSLNRFTNAPFASTRIYYALISFARSLFSTTPTQLSLSAHRYQYRESSILPVVCVIVFQGRNELSARTNVAFRLLLDATGTWNSLSMLGNFDYTYEDPNRAKRCAIRLVFFIFHPSRKYLTSKALFNYCLTVCFSIHDLHIETEEHWWNSPRMIGRERFGIGETSSNSVQIFSYSEPENMSCPCWEQPRAPSRHAKPRSMNTRHFESFMHLQVVLARAVHTQHTWPRVRAYVPACSAMGMMTSQLAPPTLSMKNVLSFSIANQRVSTKRSPILDSGSTGFCETQSPRCCLALRILRRYRFNSIRLSITIIALRVVSGKCYVICFPRIFFIRSTSSYASNRVSILYCRSVACSIDALFPCRRINQWRGGMKGIVLFNRQYQKK